MARTYRALAALLSYPTEDLLAAAGQIAAVLADENIVFFDVNNHIQTIWPDRISMPRRSDMCPCSIAAGRFPYICSNIYTERIAIAARRWRI